MRSLLDRPIAFHPALAKLFGGINEAIFWQQIYYWSDKGRLADGWVYKTKEELENETTLTREQQDKARKNLKSKGYLKTLLKKVGGAPTIHYQCQVGLVENTLMEKCETHESIEKRETHYSSIQRVPESTNKEIEKISISSFEPKRQNTKQKFTVVLDEEGPQTKSSGQPKNKTALRLRKRFAEMCHKKIGVWPMEDVGGYVLILGAMEKGRLTEEQILDLFDEWFGLPKPDEELISIGRALSARQIEQYKLRNNVV